MPSYKYVAIPAQYLDFTTGYLRAELTNEEREYIAANFGQQPLSEEDIAQLGQDRAEQDAQLKPRLAAKLSEIRYARVDAGFDISGIRILCDTRTSAYLTAIFIESQMSADFTVQWKTPAGFITLNAAMITAITRAARQFVQKCFDAEETVLAKINDGTLSDVENVSAAFETEMTSMPADL